jgi:proline iminopeptidase
MTEPSIIEVTTAEGFTLACEVSGDGPLLLGLHGGPGGEGGAYMRPLHRLGRPTQQVVTFDQLGTARSQTPPDQYDWTVARAAADIDAVRAHFGHERIDVIGHSWGGMLALQYALDFPDRVGRLILSNTVASTARMTAEFLAQVLEVLPVADAAAALTADALGEHDDPQFLRAVTAWLAAYATNGEPQATDELTAETPKPGPAGHGLWGTALWFATGALRGWDVEARLGEITAPTLAIHGGHDMSTKAVNEVMAAGIPDCEWITLNRNGHGMFDEPNVDVYLSILDAFLHDWHPTKGSTQ